MSEYRIVYDNSFWKVQRKVECRQKWWQKLLDAKPAECWQHLGTSHYLESARQHMRELRAAEAEGVVIA